MLSRIQLIINGNISKEYNVDGEKARITDSIKADEDCFVLVKCYDLAGNLAMTNPVYIRNVPFKNKGYKSKVNVNVTQSGTAAMGFYWLDGSPVKNGFEGSFSLSMGATSVLKVETGVETKTVRLFELPELQDIFANLYTGRFNRDRLFNPGEVPAGEFRLGRIREILDNVEINLDF